MSDRYAVFGNPISHSKSPLIHTTFARESAQDLVYEAIEAPLGGFDASVDTFRAQGGRGINITAPFKLDAHAYATDHLEHARMAGASNCLKFQGDRIYAENFDGLGLVKDIESNLGYPLRGRRILMLGAGGAVRGALLPLLQQGPAALTIANRHVDKAHSLAREFASYGAHFDGVGFEELGGQSFDIVLNATSASLFGERLPIPRSVFGRNALAYELVYGKGLTPFLQQAREADAALLADGVGMLVEQAAEAFFWWRGVRPPTRSVIETLTVPLV